MAAAKEARDILSHLLAKIQDPASRFHRRYGPWAEKHGKENVEEFLFKCLRPEVVTYMQLGSENVTSMKNIGGNLNFEGRAIYLHGILGQDRRTRIYVGQTMSLYTRIKQHWNFRYRRDNPSLHYHAVQHSIFDIWAVLATLPSTVSSPCMDNPDLVLNLLEMWCCLIFRSLPQQTLAEYLPTELVPDKDSLNVALNIANPLDHGEKGKIDWVDLSDSEDPLVADYMRPTARTIKSCPLEHVQDRKTGEGTKDAESQSSLTEYEEGLALDAAKEIKSGPVEPVAPEPGGSASNLQIPIEISTRTMVLVGTAIIVGLVLWRKNPFVIVRSRS